MAPTEWYRVYLAAPEEVEIEGLESFEKQTCRNRCTISGTKDKCTMYEGIMLSVPVKKVEHKQLTRDIEISYQSRWQHQHWISLVSTYKNTPYFDYYEEFFKPFYEKEYRFLWDFNSEIHETIMALMRNERPSEVSLQKSSFSYRCTADWRGEDLNRFFGDGKSILDELFEYGPDTTDHLR
ncbi:MAG: WbqC family protein [Paludibacteraceae bacterium]|nr:WbqC family protein [Paludibacteraceae bacterium]